MVAFVLAAVLPFGAASAFGGPTAIIVDDETGEPIEGAIALAQWVKYKPTFLEGGIPYAAKARETVSDKDGKIYIKGYWTWNPFACERHLTVYKPGYALWNSEKGAINNYEPKNLSSTYNLVRLVKFEKAAEEWLKVDIGGGQRYPHRLQSSFFGKCLELDWEKYPITIDEVFRGHEGRFIQQESRRLYEENK
jgi:hypothetical protein